MKALKLNFEGINKMLTREQMRSIAGGGESSSEVSSISSGSSLTSCTAECNQPSSGVTCKGTACEAIDYWGCKKYMGTKVRIRRCQS